MIRQQKPVVIPVLIALNVFVFLGWLYEPSLAFMTEHFVVSWKHLAHGHIWVLLTSVFSHQIFIHIFINMFVLHSFGPIIEMVLGKGRFIRFYLTAGIIASASHALLSAFILGQPESGAVGASGAIAGLILLFALLFPKEKILVFGLIPVPAIFGALAFIGLDLWGLFAQASGGGLPIGHGAHLGGSFTGIFYYLFIVRPRVKALQKAARPDEQTKF